MKGEARSSELEGEALEPPPEGQRERRGSVREVGTLAYPVILSQLSVTAMGFIDSVMVGRLGATELAAV